MHTPPQPSRSPRRLFVECTETYYSGQNAGIPRVVRNVAAHLGEVAAAQGVHGSPVVLHGQHYYEFEPVQQLHPWRVALRSAVSRTITRLQHACCHPAVHRVTLRLRKAFYPRTMVRVVSRLRSSASGRHVQFGAGDVLVLLDASWNPSRWSSIRAAKAAGARLGVVVYDLIPMHHPSFVGADFRRVFADWLEAILDECDFFLAISETVADDLYRYACQVRPQRAWQRDQFGAFRLGAALDLARSRSPIRSAVRSLFADDRKLSPYMTVGTLQPRKNHEVLLDAFERIWPHYPEARLCIVGKVGWMCQELVTRIRHHPQLGRGLYHFEDLSDTELAYVYQRAKALLFPSLAEGFGLPIVEALQYGLPVLASNIPIHREVGRDFCTYFQPRDSQGLAQLIETYEQTGRPPATRQPGQYEIVSWRDSCCEFTTQCLRRAYDHSAATRHAA